MPISSWILDIVFLVVVALAGLFLNGIKKDVKKVDKKVDDIDGKVDNLEITVKSHTTNISDIVLMDSAEKRIDLKVRQALEYLDKDDEEEKVIGAFIQSMGDYGKLCIEWAIHNKLKVTPQEVSAKYETCNIEIRDLLTKTPGDFSSKVRPVLIEISAHHVNRVIQIATDNLFNSKLDRFFTLTEQTINEIITTIVRGWIEYKIDKNVDKRV